MTMSVTITSDPDEIANIQTAIDCLNFVSNFATAPIDLNTKTIKLQQIKDSLNYLSSILSILNTKGMTIEDYEESLNYL